MRAEDLPTFDEIAAGTLESLDAARSALSDARDWLRSDWKQGSGPTNDQVTAKLRVFELIGETKALIDEAKGALYS
jgi:hypothetical protein